MMRGGARSFTSHYDGSRHGSGHGDANRYRTRSHPGGSTRTGRSARARGAGLSKHLQRNRKRYNQQECNADRVFSEFPHDNLTSFDHKSSKNNEIKKPLETPCLLIMPSSHIDFLNPE
ncbi:MAG: hypothetical protein KJ649_04885 [Proteobacteria bacterium]|nr:hypothetical protein [Pseudomonadota bacterium]